MSASLARSNVDVKPVRFANILVQLLRSNLLRTWPILIAVSCCAVLVPGLAYLHNRLIDLNMINGARLQSEPFVAISMVACIVLSAIGNGQGYPLRQRVFALKLLPVSFGMIMSLNLAIQVSIFTIAYLAGNLPLLFTSIEIDFGILLPTIIGALSVAFLLSQCFFDLRLWGLFALAFVAATTVGFDFSRNITAIVKEPAWLLLSLPVCIAYSLWASISYRRSEYFDLDWLQRLIRGYFGRPEEDGYRLSIRLGLEELVSRNPRVALAWFDFRWRIFRPMCWIVVINLVYVSMDSGGWRSVFLQDYVPYRFWLLGMSITLLVWPPLGLALRGAGVQNRLPRFQATLPVSDRRLGEMLLLHFCMFQALLILVFLGSLYGSGTFHQWITGPRFANWNIVMSLGWVFGVGGTLFALLLSGRTGFVGIVLCGTTAIIVSGFCETVMFVNGAHLQVALINVQVITLFAFVFWHCYQKKLASYKLQFASLLVVAIQLYFNQDCITQQELPQTKLYGLVLIPALPFVAVPTAVYFNRHR